MRLCLSLAVIFAASAVAHFPVCWTLRLRGCAGWLLSDSSQPSGNSDGAVPAPKYALTA